MRVLLADDHSIVRRGLKSLLEEAGLSVVAEAADGLDAVRLCDEHRPDLLILDIAMPKLNGIEVAARAQKLDRPPGVIILSMHADESYIIRALAAGARAYLLKSATDEDLLPAVRAVASGKPYFSPAVTAVLVEDYVRRLHTRGLTDSFHLLTDREKEGANRARFLFDDGRIPRRSNSVKESPAAFPRISNGLRPPTSEAPHS